MGRPARHAHATILDCAKKVAPEVGPQKLTIASIAARAGAPVGSIYHRYASRDEILAAVRYTCRWVRRHPREARLMLLHRREDFAAERWPKHYRRRAETLAATAGERLQRYAARLLGRSRPAELRIVRSVLVDLPTAVLKRDIEAGEAPAKDIEEFLLETCAYALRRARARRARE